MCTSEPRGSAVRYLTRSLTCAVRCALRLWEVGCSRYLCPTRRGVAGRGGAWRDPRHLIAGAELCFGAPRNPAPVPQACVVCATQLSPARSWPAARQPRSGFNASLGPRRRHVLADVGRMQVCLRARVSSPHARAAFHAPWARLGIFSTDERWREAWPFSPGWRADLRLPRALSTLTFGQSRLPSVAVASVARGAWWPERAARLV